MDDKLLSVCVSTYEDSLNHDLGFCIHCDHLVEPLDTNTQGAFCPRCNRYSVYGLTAIIQRFGV